MAPAVGGDDPDVGGRRLSAGNGVEEGRVVKPLDLVVDTARFVDRGAQADTPYASVKALPEYAFDAYA